ncbi:MAG: CaiB/BaiF CoA-transferase family protein [Candidatus Sericytochromatia bacterium]
MNMLPLKGIRVVDLSRVVSGPYCTMMLGDLGAEIIKIEHPKVKDETRTWGPPFHENRDDSAYYLSMNRNKKSLTLDFKQEEGKKVLLKIIEQSDILVENFRVGTLEKLGLGYEDIKKTNPQLIYCSISGYGSTGPYANKGGYDVIVQGMGGLMSINGTDEQMMKVGVPIVDLTTAMMASQAILAALFVRARTGHGQKVEASLLETQVACLANVGSNYLLTGKLPKRNGNQHPNIVPYQPYKSKDGDFILSVTNQKLWENFCNAIDKNEFINDERFKTNSDRLKNRDLLNSYLEDIFKTKTNKEWIDLFESVGVPVGPINNLEQVFNDPQVLHRDMLVSIPHESGEIKTAGIPIKFSDTKPSIRLAPPLFGEHTKEIICDFLKYDENEYLDLKNKEII